MQSNTIILHAGSSSLPSIFTARPEARSRLRDFFSSHIRNSNTRRAYMEAVRQFSNFCAEHGIVDLAQVEPVHVAAFVEAQLKLHSKPTVKQRLAALRMLFDWMVVGQVLPLNPAHAVRGPKHTQRRGKTRSAGHGGENSARFHRHRFLARLTGPCPDRPDGVHVCACWSGNFHEGRRLLRAKPARLGAPAREGW